MNKELLKQRLVQQQNSTISDISEKISTTHSMVDIDETDTVDPEDLSHQSEEAEAEHLFKLQLHKAKIDLNLIESLDFSTKQKVEPGAFVQTEKFNFVVACATTPFDYDGKHIIGISTDSPIYKEMKDKEAGSSFSISGNNYTILEIH